MPRRFRLMKRIRNAWRRLFKPKVRELEGFDEDNQMLEDDLEEMLTGVSHYVEKMREENLKNIEMIRRGHDSIDDMDNNQNYYMGEYTEPKVLFDETEMEEYTDPKVVVDETEREIIVSKEEEITCIRCEHCRCEVLVKIMIRPIGQ